MLGLNATLGMDAEQHGELLVGDRFQQPRFPAQRRRRDRYGCDRVTGVMLAVAKRPLAVLPRLPPVDRAEADEDRAGRQALSQSFPLLSFELDPAFEPVQER